MLTDVAGIFVTFPVPLDPVPPDVPDPPVPLLPLPDAPPEFAAAVTFTLQVAFFPFTVFTVIFALPALFAVTTPEALTLATEELLLDQRREEEAFFGLNFTVSCRTSPVFKFKDFGFNFIFFGFGSTVTLHFAVTPEEAFTVMVALPAFPAVMTPFLFTFATLVLLLFIVTFPLAFCGETVYRKVAFPPESRVTRLKFSLIFFTCGLTTRTVQVAFFPLAVVTVIFVLPAFSAVTCPLAFTVATFGLLLLHVSLLVTPAGRSVAVRDFVFPILIVMEDLFN